MRLLCRIGLHNWSSWTAHKTFQIDSRPALYGIPVGEWKLSGYRIVHERTCKSCGAPHYKVSEITVAK